MGGGIRPGLTRCHESQLIPRERIQGAGEAPSTEEKSSAAPRISSFRGRAVTVPTYGTSGAVSRMAVSGGERPRQPTDSHGV